MGNLSFKIRDRVLVHCRVWRVPHEFDRFAKVTEKLLVVKKVSLQLVQLSRVLQMCRTVGRFLQNLCEHNKPRENSVLRVSGSDVHKALRVLHPTHTMRTTGWQEIQRLDPLTSHRFSANIHYHQFFAQEIEGV